MTKNKLSTIEARTLRKAIIFVWAQILLIIGFLYLLNESLPVDISDTEQIAIIIDDIEVVKSRYSDQLVVYSNSIKYIFPKRTILDNELTNGELSEMLRIQDQLQITYYERFSVFGKKNMIIAAQSENEIYRSYENYCSIARSGIVPTVVVFSILEIILCGAAIVFVWLHFHTLKGIKRKLKRKSTT